MMKNSKLRFFGFSFFTALTCMSLFVACGKDDDGNPAVGTAQACIDQNGQTTNIDAYRAQMQQYQYNNFNNQNQFGYGYNPSGLPSCQSILSQQGFPQNNFSNPNWNNQQNSWGFNQSYAYQTQAIGFQAINSGYPVLLSSSNPARSETLVASLKAGDVIKVAGTRVWYASSLGNWSFSNMGGTEKLLSTNDSNGLVLYVNNRYIKASEGTTIQITEDCELHAGVLNNNVLYSRTVNGTSGQVGVYIQRKNF